MITCIVYDNRLKNLVIPPDILPEGGKPHPHHFKSTTLDNLVELCGRICYDSCKQIKTRDSSEYHKHINDVQHTSVQRHAYLTFRILVGHHDVLDVYRALTGIPCRPGCFFIENIGLGGSEFEVSINLCAIKEWEKFSRDNLSPISCEIHSKFLQYAASIAPLVMGPINVLTERNNLIIEPIRPISETQVWVSFYIAGISRNLSLELNRHTTQYAVSQRSTRYVDEDSSQFIKHSLYIRYESEIKNLLGEFYLGCHERESRRIYRGLIEILTDHMVRDGVDKFTARKQARGAARGFLLSSLETEKIFTASLWQWKEILRQRLHDSADAEIKELASAIKTELKLRFPGVKLHG